LVSPRYFVTILGWHDVDDVWRASIAQGKFEGFCFGLFVSLDPAIEGAMQPTGPLADPI